MTAATAASPVPQLHALTGLRGLAAWAVVLYHARLSLLNVLPGRTIDALGMGYLAVDLFFLLSGFVMWLNYGARFGERGLSEAPLFWWRRLARIWPLHAAILVALMLFAMLLSATGRDASPFPWAELPLHFALLQNWGFTAALTWNHPAWSISTEMAAYVLFPLVAAGLGRRRLPVAALLAMGAGLVLALHLLFAALGYRSLGQGIEVLGLWRCLAEFMLGMILCNLWQLWRGRRGAALASLVAAAAMLGAGLFLGAAETLFVPAAFAAGLLALALDQGTVARLLGSTPLRWLGDVSYSTYLAHFPLLIAARILATGADGQFGWSGITAYLLALLVLSGVLFHGLEKPAQRWLLRRKPTSLILRTAD